MYIPENARPLQRIFYPTNYTAKHAKPRHQPSDRDQRAQQRLKDKAFKAKIWDTAYIALGPAALHTVHQTFDPGFLVLFHLPPLQTSATIGTTPTLYVIQRDRHCMPTADYYFTNIKPDPILIPPHTEKKDTAPISQPPAEDTIQDDLPPLKPGEMRVYPSTIAVNNLLLIYHYTWCVPGYGNKFSNLKISSQNLTGRKHTCVTVHCLSPIILFTM